MTGRAARLATPLRIRRAFRNWPRVLADHLGVVRGPYVAELRDGASFEVRGRTDDRHVLYEIFVQGAYDAPLHPGDIVVDVGANIGGFTVAAALRGARVVAFEPSPDNFGALERNVRRNGVQAELSPLAVADAPRTAQLVIPDDARFSGRYSLHEGRGQQTVEVRCISFDEVLSEFSLPHIDLLKLDCQGSEYEILFSASPDSLGRVRAIVVECESFPDRPEWSAEAMAGFLRDHGFTVSADGGMVRARRDAPLRAPA